MTPLFSSSKSEPTRHQQQRISNIPVRTPQFRSRMGYDAFSLFKWKRAQTAKYPEARETSIYHDEADFLNSISYPKRHLVDFGDTDGWR